MRREGAGWLVEVSDGDGKRAGEIKTEQQERYR